MKRSCRCHDSAARRRSRSAPARDGHRFVTQPRIPERRRLRGAVSDLDRVRPGAPRRGCRGAGGPASHAASDMPSTRHVFLTSTVEFRKLLILRGSHFALARLPQLGGYGSANPLILRDRTSKGRHYRCRTKRSGEGCQTEIRGAGCCGRAMPSCCSSSSCCLFGRVWRGRTRCRPSVVGRCTSAIWMVAKASMMARGVRPEARGRARFFRVTSRQ